MKPTRRRADNKLFYRIGEVCMKTGVEPHMLRSWEHEFDALRPRKNRSGHRIYKESDIDLVLKIKSLVREQGFTLNGAKKQMNRSSRGSDSTDRSHHVLPAQEIKKEIKAIRDLLLECVNLLDSLP